MYHYQARTAVISPGQNYRGKPWKKQALVPRFPTNSDVFPQYVWSFARVIAPSIDKMRHNYDYCTVLHVGGCTPAKRWPLKASRDNEKRQFGAWMKNTTSISTERSGSRNPGNTTWAVVSENNWPCCSSLLRKGVSLDLENDVSSGGTCRYVFKAASGVFSTCTSVRRLRNVQPGANHS